jgi:hypothetical protein
MKKAYYQMALRNPGFVAWCCALKLEMAVRLVQDIIARVLRSDIVPGRDKAVELLAHELQQRLGVDVSVEDLPDLKYYGVADDFYASLERPCPRTHCLMDCWRAAN